ncbi:MAG: RidA family protein [Alphaproteobacteria bacterium]
MSKKVYHFDDLKEPKTPYNNLVSSEGKLVFISTQPSVDWHTGEFIDGDIYTQAEKAMENVKMFVERAGSCVNKIIKVGIFLSDLNDFDAMNEIYLKYFPNPENQPARFTLQTSFPNPKIKVEFEAVAVVDNEK